MKCLKFLVLSVAALSTIWCSGANAQTLGRSLGLRSEPIVKRLAGTPAQLIGLGLQDPDQADPGIGKSVPMPEPEGYVIPKGGDVGPGAPCMGCGPCAGLWDSFCGGHCRIRPLGCGCGLRHGCGRACVDRFCGCGRPTFAHWGHRGCGCGHFGHAPCLVGCGSPCDAGCGTHWGRGCGLFHGCHAHRSFSRFLGGCSSCVSGGCVSGGCVAGSCVSGGCVGCVGGGAKHDYMPTQKGLVPEATEAPLPVPEDNAADSDDAKSARRSLPFSRPVAHVLDWK